MSVLKKITVFSASILIFFVSAVVAADTSSSILSPSFSSPFSISLKLGDTDPSVISLQKILNSDPDTMVATSGAGSPGQETSYFGVLTQQAVIRFQNKYSADILVPAGLSSGTGFVGQRTIQKLNTLSADNADLSADAQNDSRAGQNLNPVVSAQSFAVLPSEKIDIYTTDKKTAALQESFTNLVNTALAKGEKPVIPTNLFNSAPSLVLIYSLSSHTGMPGVTLSLTGSGFDSDNTVYFGSSYVVRHVSGVGTLTFAVPAIPPGRYDIVVKNISGISNSQIFIVTSTTSPQVTVSGATPSTVTYGGTVTIYGTGFTQTNNQIITQFATIDGVSSSDGTSLTFTFKPEAFAVISTLGDQNKSYPVPLMVVNDNGYASAQNILTFDY